MPEGIVMRSTGSWYEVRTQDRLLVRCRLRGKIKLQDLKVNNPIAVGDTVACQPQPGQRIPTDNRHGLCPAAANRTDRQI